MKKIRFLFQKALLKCTKFFLTNLNINRKNKKIFNLLLFFIILLIFIIFFCILEYYFCKNSLNRFQTEIKLSEKELLIKLDKFISYSQYFEDLILYCVFYDIKNGFYIDVGANDPDYISVTKAFYIRGWKGINIEPLPSAYLKLLNSRKRDINLNIGAGEKKGKAIFYSRGSGSTTLKKYKRNAKPITIYINTLSNICKKYLPIKKEIHFCKIDVEGGEKNVLMGYDFQNYRPKIFCLESTRPGSYVPNYELWDEILIKNDYSFVYQYKINRFYTDNRISGLRERFINIDKYIKNYKYKLMNKTQI